MEDGMVGGDGQVSHILGETNYGWLGTTASQIFIMQLGFVCYEAGFVHPIWYVLIYIISGHTQF